ncbi:hypothetical protein QQX98_000353 [Neonectria punicea]|uniref:Aminoglycoside phosphotransferase domain-containing protein n=1 Tax=Neonectria punicea TaxID=979145 RepID=A0ABR1HU80_9HYPO
MTEIYSLDGAISSFFDSNTSATRQQCDDFALHHAGGPLDPVPIQGSFSYTVTAWRDKSKIVQFRTQDSSLDIGMINLAKTVHPQFVAGCRYFAQSWNFQQQLDPDDLAALLAEFRSKFDLLTKALPPQLLPNLNRVYSRLPSLFSGVLPFVLSHGDLCEMNLLISPETGNITGVVDWAEARILPFGFSLWGFENILGFMDSRGWHYYDNRDQLEDLFWRTFWAEAPDASKVDLELIQTARMAGLFCRYGLVVEGKDLKAPIDHSDSPALAYLDALCTVDD